MASTTLEANRNAVNLLWQQKIRNAKEISRRIGVPMKDMSVYYKKLVKLL